MTSKFVESFLVAGLGDDLKPEGAKKNLLCGVKDVVFVRGDIGQLREAVASAAEVSAKLKYVRFMTLSEEFKVHLAIQYSHPFKGEDTSALFGLELIRREPGSPAPTTQCTIVRTIEISDIQLPADLFE